MSFRGVVNEFVANGALPVLMQLLVKESFDIQTRIRVAAAICNLSHARHAQRRHGLHHQRRRTNSCPAYSFCSCDAVSLLVDSVIGEHQALTGATALIFRSMLISGNLLSFNGVQQRTGYRYIGTVDGGKRCTHGLIEGVDALSECGDQRYHCGCSHSNDSHQSWDLTLLSTMQCVVGGRK